MVTKAVRKTVTTNDLMDVMQDMMQMTSNGFLRLENRMDKLEGRMDALEERMDALEGRMGSMEGRMDGLEGHMGSLENRVGTIETDLKDIKKRLIQHDLQFIGLRRIIQELVDKHSAYINDIADILDRVTALEKQAPHVTPEEVYELQQLLQKLVDWALLTAKTVKVPLELP